MLSSAFYLIGAAQYSCPDDLESITKEYRTKEWLLDSHYREFYYAYDQLIDTVDYEKLRELVENIYTNEYLAKVLPRWNGAFCSNGSIAVLPMQRNFFNQHIRSSKDKVIVIISDAWRYEAGHSLYQKLQEDAKCIATLDAMRSAVLYATWHGGALTA